jgi:hypothetical protein
MRFLARLVTAVILAAVWVVLNGVVDRALYRPDASPAWKAATYVPTLVLASLFVLAFETVGKKISKDK